MMTFRRFPLLLAAPLIVAAGAALADPVVDQKDKQFSEKSVTLTSGQAIRFTNSDTVTHNIAVKAPDGSEAPGITEKPGDDARISFTTPGDSTVHCLIHPKMKMTVHVN